MITLSELKYKIESSSNLVKKVAEKEDLLLLLQKAIEQCIRAYQNGHRIYLCGNGGSAADAQHIAAELTGRFAYDRPPLAAEALHTDTSYITAVANDYDFDKIYSRALQAKGKEGDVLIALSTSGNSKNVCAALETAKLKGMFSIGFSGQEGGRLKELSEICLCVPSQTTARIQEVHILLGHILCGEIEKTLFPL